MSYNKNLRIDFGEDAEGQDWNIVNDSVMGGLSHSEMAFTKNTLIFKGELSLRNNGGFASIRSSNQKFDLSKYTTVKIKFRSTGRDFAFRLASSDLYYKPNYKNSFSSSTGEWEIIELKISDFKEYTMGEISNLNVSKDKLESIVRIGIIISDKKEGQFDIEVNSIEFQ